MQSVIYTVLLATTVPNLQIENFYRFIFQRKKMLPNCHGTYAKKETENSMPLLKHYKHFLC